MARPVIFALKNGFHGKTIGASLMTFSEDYRRPFLYLGLNTIFIDPDNTFEIESLIDELSKPFYSFKIVDSEVKLTKSPFPLFTTIIAEPIQGEAGIREISTENLKTLEIIGKKMKILIDGLKKLKEKYPDVIKDVRGRGLMIDVDFIIDPNSDNLVMRNTSYWKNPNYILFSYLHEVHNIRALPTSSSSSTLRLEPGIYITTAEIKKTLVAFEHLCIILQKSDSYHLLLHLATQDRSHRDVQIINYSNGINKKRFLNKYKISPVPKVAFIAHVISPDTLRANSEGFSRLTPDEIESYISRNNIVRSNAPDYPIRIMSKQGKEVDIVFYIINQTADQIISCLHSDGLKEFQNVLYNTAKEAHELGAIVVGFGGFTSIAANNCKSIPNITGLSYTTGNSLTTGIGYRALLLKAENLGIEFSTSKAVVIGATGNIGQVYSSLLTEKVN